MGVIQVSFFDGVEYEIVGGKAYKITHETKPAAPEAPKPDPNHFAGEKCRPCNYAENSDGMYGAHCGECECCSEKLSS